jgi:hypothetical protein
MATEELNSETTSFSIYPNPTNGEYITFNLGNAAGNEMVSIAILDGSGKCVEQITLNSSVGNNYRHNFQNRLATGFYIIVMNADGKRIEKKLIVN